MDANFYDIIVICTYPISGHLRGCVSSCFVLVCFATSLGLVGFGCDPFFVSVLSNKEEARCVNLLKTSFCIAVGILEEK